MLLDLIIASFLISFLRGGRFKDIPRFKKLTFLIISVAFQLLCIVLHGGIGNFLISLAYLSALVFLFFNREWEDIRVIMIGWMMNAITIWANFGKMPIDLVQARKTPFDVTALINGTDWKHTLVNNSTHLAFLSDVVYLHYPVPRVISIGDIFISLGVFLLIQRIMEKPISLKKIHEGKGNVVEN